MEKSYFYSRYKSYRTVIKRTTSRMIDGELQTVPAVMVKFSGGFLSTDDKDVIKVLEKDPNCVQVKEGDIKKIKMGKKQFKGNLVLSEAQIDPDKAVQEAEEKAGKAEKKAADLEAENAKLKAQLEKAKKDGKDL